MPATDEQIFDHGYADCKRGGKRIPPAFICALRKGACYVWFDGWDAAKYGENDGQESRAPDPNQA